MYASDLWTPTHVEAVVLLFYHQPLARQKLQSGVVHVNTVVALAVVSNCNHEVIDRRHGSEEAVGD